MFQQDRYSRLGWNFGGGGAAGAAVTDILTAVGVNGCQNQGADVEWLLLTDKRSKLRQVFALETNVVLNGKEIEWVNSLSLAHSFFLPLSLSLSLSLSLLPSFSLSHTLSLTHTHTNTQSNTHTHIQGLWRVPEHTVAAGRKVIVKRPPNACKEAC